MNNYIPDVNKFKLSGPPQWWLRQLWDFDSSLVVVPSQQGFYYRLAQRRKPNLPERLTRDMLWQQSDTKMLARHGLIPVTTILATANWSNPFMFEELRRRAPWRLGGAEAVINNIEDGEKMDELKRQEETQDVLNQLGKDGWGLYNKKIGVRSHMWSPRTKKSEGVPQKSPAIKIVRG